MLPKELKTSERINSVSLVKDYEDEVLCTIDLQDSSIKFTDGLTPEESEECYKFIMKYT